MINEIDKNGFDEILTKQNKLIIVDFFAQWCMPCKMLSPILEKTAEEHTEIEVYKVDIDENETLVSEYSIESVPTLIFIKNGNIINQEIGVRSVKELDELIEKLNK